MFPTTLGTLAKDAIHMALALSRRTPSPKNRKFNKACSAGLVKANEATVKDME